MTMMMIGRHFRAVMLSLQTVFCLETVLRPYFCVLFLVFVLIHDQDVNPLVLVLRLFSWSAQQELFRKLVIVFKTFKTFVK